MTSADLDNAKKANNQYDPNHSSGRSTISTTSSHASLNNSKEDFSSWIRSQGRNMCSRKQLYRKVPILDWLPKYNLETGISDLIAGITVGLTVIPQGIAYALVAELPPQYGLYSAFMGCFIYCIFGSSKDITVGPTAIMALMTAEHAQGKTIDLVILLCFLSGVIIMLLGILRLGFVIDFISVPVIAGFTSAAAITIASSQVKGLFGLTSVGHGSKGHGIIATWSNIIKSFKTIRANDTILGIVCVIVLLLLRELKKTNWFDEIKPEEDQAKVGAIRRACNRMSPGVRRFISKCVWLLSTARNAVVVCICLGIAYAFDPVLPDDPHASRNTTFILTGKIDGGLPPFEPPPFSSTLENDETLNFGQMLGELGSAIIIIPLVAILENVAIAKAFAGGKPVDASQEMIALGACNIMGSFVSSMPTTGSFSRTAVNSASGVKTPFGGIYTGVLVILALAILMPMCAYIPKASLSAVIITAVIFMVEYEVIKPMYKSKKSDVAVALITFFTCLFWALEFGILLGVAVQVFFILYHTARPNIDVSVETLSGPNSEYLRIKTDRALFFPSVSYVRNVVNKIGLRHHNENERPTPVVLDCTHIYASDYTGSKGFEAMVMDFKKRDQPILFFNMRSDVQRNLFGPCGKHIIIVHSEDELKERLRELLPDEDGDGGEKQPISDDPLLPSNA